MLTNSRPLSRFIALVVLSVFLAQHALAQGTVASMPSTAQIVAKADEYMLAAGTINHFSANVYDSLAEAYALNGDQELAIKNYEKSLALDPQNANAVEQIKKLRGDK